MTKKHFRCRLNFDMRHTRHSRHWLVSTCIISLYLLIILLISVTQVHRKSDMTSCMWMQFTAVSRVSLFITIHGAKIIACRHKANPWTTHFCGLVLKTLHWKWLCGSSMVLFHSGWGIKTQASRRSWEWNKTKLDPYNHFQCRNEFKDSKIQKD